MKKQYTTPATAVLASDFKTAFMEFSQLNVNLGEEGDQEEAEAKNTDGSIWDDEHNPLDYLPKVFKDMWGEE